MTITIAVAGRIATVTATTQVVAGNTYPVVLSLDSEWTGSLFMRVRFGSLFYDIPFASSDATVDVQFPVGYPEVGIGIFSEALQVCTNEARVRLLRSILEAGEEVVEFDGDLYDQWAGEVTALLTDDAFDAESTKPVQNAVITAWKGTVALDASVVHKTGNETIAGEKKFTKSPVIQTSGEYAALWMDGDLAYDAVGVHTRINMRDYKDGSKSICSTIINELVNGGYSQLRLGNAKPDRTGNFYLDVRAYTDHMLAMVTPYYPVDGNGNPQALTANALVASGNLAVDPRLVHTTGNEVVAGEKTFSGITDIPKLRSASVTVQMEVGTWYKMYTITPFSAGQTIFLEIFNTSNISTMVDAKLRIQVPNASWPYDPAGNLFNVGSALVGKLAKTADGKLEVWLCKASGSAQLIMLNGEYIGALVPTPVGTSGSEPVQGDDYTLVKNITVVS